MRFDIMEALRAALEPFAQAADEIETVAPGWAHDAFPFRLFDGLGYVPNVTITFGDLRRARAALARSRGDDAA